MILTNKQEEGLKLAVKRFKDKEPYTCIAGMAGSGKAQPMDTIIPTPCGNKRLGELKVGDYVFDRMGEPTKVLGVYPQGLKRVYTVYLSDGRHTEACSEHNWEVIDSFGRNRLCTTKEIKDNINQKYSLPFTAAAKYSSEEYSGPLNIALASQYKYGSIEQRKALIEGITEFESDNFDLLKDIQEICYSLQYGAKIINNKIMISHDKMPVFIDKIVEECYEKEMVCIYVDNKEHLYLTNDYIVTHNTTLVNLIVNALDLTDDEVCYIAYTGKATQVLREKGCKNALTAHRLLYKVEKIGEIYNFIPKRHIPQFKLIVVDEVSMMPKEMWKLLLSHKIPIIALGDPFQLPPVQEIDSGILKKPHIFLDEVVRQALDNEIIRFSMYAREGQPLPLYKGEQVKIIQQSSLPLGVLLWADQVICGKNNTRRRINLAMHQEYTKTDDSCPSEGDKVVCLHNEWSCLNDAGEPLINGMIGHIKNLYWTEDRKVKFLTKIPIMDFYLDTTSPFYSIKFDPTMFVAGKPADTNSFSKYKIKQFDFGYAITTWKAQGSEWNNVVFIQENFNSMTKEENQKFLYTSITRAREKLIILR